MSVDKNMFVWIQSNSVLKQIYVNAVKRTNKLKIVIYTRLLIKNNIESDQINLLKGNFYTFKHHFKPFFYATINRMCS